MAHYDIFRQGLAIKYPAYGLALWEPNPGPLFPPVEIGDVGFIRGGKFHRLFNALLPADHPSHQRFGVPEYHEPLQLNVLEHIDVGTLCPNNFRSAGVMPLSSGVGVFASGPELDRVSFLCSKKAGAILSLPVLAQRQDTLLQGDFGKWIVSHIDLWFAFARGLGLGITRMEDIVLVTGCHLATSWANIAFSEGCGEEQVSFGVRVSGVSNVEWWFPPEEIQGAASNLGPSGRNLPEDQCIFIRGFRATKLLGIICRIRRLQGAAEPTHSRDEDKDEPGPELQLELEPDVHPSLLPTPSEIKDPLYALLEYIATQAPDCDMALIHDDDLRYMKDSSLETLRSDEVIEHLRITAPQIWQVQCGNSDDGAPASRVATLTKYSFGARTAQNEYQVTPLHLASYKGQVDTTRALLKRGAEVNAQDEDDSTPLHEASSEGHAEVARVLLENGADAEARDKNRSTPLHRAASEGQVEVARTLLECGADITARDKHRYTPLHLAASKGEVQVARALLESGADTSAQDGNGSTPLHRASSQGHVELARVLLENGADVKSRDNNRWTPLHIASSMGQVKVARVLLNCGAYTTDDDRDAWTPLHWASSMGHVEVTRALLESGADLDTTANGLTSLHLASSGGHVEISCVLLDHGANVNARDQNGTTPLHLALYWGYEGLARVLLEHAADVNAVDNIGSTPLKRASPMRHAEFIRVLLDHGADTMDRDKT